MAARQPAPAPLSVVEDFVNTYEIDGEAREEALATPDDLAAWLEERGLMESGIGLTEADRERATQVREDLRCLLLANNGESLEPGVLARLNEMGREAHLSVRFVDSGRSELAPESAGIASALGRILAIVHAAMADGTWARLKACRNEECMWVFYDSSKNHSATWCSMRVCGNRMKARSYRRRHSAEHA